MQTKIFNATTGEMTEREMNAEELAAYKSAQEEIETEAEAKATTSAKKAALLEKLGITEDEARLLLL